MRHWGVPLFQPLARPTMFGSATDVKFCKSVDTVPVLLLMREDDEGTRKVLQMLIFEN